MLQPMPIRVVRNLLNRFWGGGGATADSDESNSDVEERDHDGVD
jgi:hypothetical protein